MQINKEYNIYLRILFFLSILLVVLIAVSIPTVNALNYTVSTNGDDADDGLFDPFLSVGKAINTTNSKSGGNNIIIYNGTYSGDSNCNINVNKNVSIYSAKYLGLSTRDTTLDAKNSSRFFNVASGVTLNVYGITFRNGDAGTDFGGAIYSSGGICKLNNVNFLNCKGFTGGAVFASNANNWSFIDVKFEKCSSKKGGAIDAAQDNANWSFVGVSFVNCSSIDNGNGGAIYATSGDSSWSFVGVSFQDCIAYDGGGVFAGATDFSWSFVNVSFLNCIAYNDGGAVFAGAGDSYWSFNGASFQDCIAYNNGGAIYASYTADYWSFVNAIFEKCNSDCGAIFSEGSYWSFENSTFINCECAIYGSDNANDWLLVNVAFVNCSSNRGAIFSEGSDWYLEDVTFINSGDSEGAIVGGDDGTWEIKNDGYLSSPSTSMSVSSVVADYGSSITLTATVLNANKKGIARAIIVFTVNGKVVATVVTDANGKATYTYNPGLNGGIYSYSARLESDSYDESSATGNIVINKVQTSHIVTNTEYMGIFGNVVTFTSTIKDKNGKLLANKLVDIFIDGKKVGTTTTNGDGLASYKHRINKTGISQIEFRYNGDVNSFESSAKFTLAVKKHSSVLITNKIKKRGRKIILTSTVKNTGPDKLSGKITFKLVKGFKYIKISKKIGKYTYNKKKGTITFTITNLAKNKFKVAKLTITFKKSIKGKKYLTNVVTSTNTLKLTTKNI